MAEPSLRKQIVFFSFFIPATVGCGLAFGWSRAWIGAAAVSVVWVVGDLLFGSAFDRRANRGFKISELFDSVELIGRAAEIRIEGTARRYRAEFASADSPVTSEMTCDERRVARALAHLGFPSATVTVIQRTTAENVGEPVIELPAGLA